MYIYVCMYIDSWIDTYMNVRNSNSDHPHRFARTKVGGAVTGVFSSLVKIFSQDPLDASLQDPSNLKPLHLQQVAGAPVDARQLIADFDPAQSVAKKGR